MTPAQANLVYALRQNRRAVERFAGAGESASSKFSKLVRKIIEGTDANVEEAVIMIIAEDRPLAEKVAEEIGSYPASDREFAFLQKHI